MHLLQPIDLLKLFFGSKSIKKKKQKHPLTKFQGCLFSYIDFNRPHFAYFNFAHFNMEERFGLIWVDLEGACFKSEIYFCLFCV